MKNTNKRSLSEYDEQDLIKQYEIEKAENILQLKSKYRKIVNAGIASWVKDFQAGQIKIDTVDDLKKLIELDLQLQNDDQD
ncbi:hypothetical protein [Virgibacillus salexigens]|uniref:Transposase n=1 Tax=Virgibacillus kapii TaxID=1638645 RepID=A0ABQ2DCB6_9BACI|nr:hypothetical protein [Virgibacillus kapii]GGJ51108.1 hypothetical protein GCM10007111_11670 [Virgibacillus kapii]